jgi:hypothetical protein
LNSGCRSQSAPLSEGHSDPNAMRPAADLLDSFRNRLMIVIEE